MAVRDSRSIEKSLFSPGSRKFFRLKTDQVRLLFIGLVLVADDFGRLEGDNDDLVAVFPKMKMTADDVSEHIKDMVAAELITQYKANGHKYIEINDFVDHQNWNGVSSKGSKIPANPRAVSSTSRSGRGAPVAVVVEIDENAATTPKSIPCFSNTYTKESIATTATNDADEAYRQAKRIFRMKVGKSIGSLSNRVSQWEGLVRDHGSNVIIRAVEIWAGELGKGGRNLMWPLAVFLKNASEFIEAASVQNEQEVEKKSDEDVWAAAIAADDERIRKGKEDDLRAREEEQKLIELGRGVI